MFGVTKFDMNGIELVESYRGKWYDILVALGVSGDYLDGCHHPCPVCGGTDRFRFDDKDGGGTWYCNQHMPKRAGYGLQLVQEIFKTDAIGAFNMINDVIGKCSTDNCAVLRPRKDPKIQLNRLWQRSLCLTGNDPISRYLHGRGLTLQPDNVRYCEACFESWSREYKKAMIALIQNADGKPISLHRTYAGVNEQGKRIKKMMSGTESLVGGAIRLFIPDGKLFQYGVLGIAEGIETAVSCAQMFQIATWASINSALMESWTPPKSVGSTFIKEIIIFADNDANYAGQKAAYILANRLYNQDLIVSVKMPDETGDFNDVLRNER